MSCICVYLNCNNTSIVILRYDNTISYNHKIFFRATCHHRLYIPLYTNIIYGVIRHKCLEGIKDVQCSATVLNARNALVRTVGLCHGHKHNL